MTKQNINISGLSKIKCEECDSEVFEQVFVIHKLSALDPVNPDGQERIIPAMAFRCAKCREILDYEY